jgi:ABC-type phosphate transport system auxiliary subunit
MDRTEIIRLLRLFPGRSGACAHAVAMLEADSNEIEQLRAEVNGLELAEEGAKTAFAHVVHQKHEVERECKKLRSLLDGAYADIRRGALTPNVGHERPDTAPQE